MTDENKRAVIARRALRINALTPEQANAALHYLSGYTPEGIDLCLARHNVPGHALCGAFDAMREADPDGAADALIGLLEGDALAKIRARILEEDAAAPCSTPALHAKGRCMCAAITWTDTAAAEQAEADRDAAPDTAQPEDTPEPASLAGALKASLAAAQPEDVAQPADVPMLECRECGATDGPMVSPGSGTGLRCYNSVNCAERQKAGTR